MLVLRRKEGQWVTVTHKSGDVMNIRVSTVRFGDPRGCDLVFDDAERNFDVQRPERAVPAETANGAGER